MQKQVLNYRIKCLLEDGIEVPTENTEQELITSTKVSIEGSGATSQVIVA